MEHELLKGEIYSKIVTIQKKYKSLLNNDFPTTGAIYLTNLICKIINLIITRYKYFSIQQIKRINHIFYQIEIIYSYLNESQILNVPWSIIPSIEKLFNNIKKDAGFVISPMITYNYSIIHSNIISTLRSFAENPNLLFDYTDDETLKNDVDKLFSEVDSEIYFIFFPKLERVSALHFTLLGHEIGHTYSQKWIKKYFSKFSEINDLENKFISIAKKEYTEKMTSTEFEESDLFSTVFATNQNAIYIDITKKILSELISDIFGAYIFGDSSIIASYLFAIKTSLDDKSGWERGYLSWRYRLNIINDALLYIKKKYKYQNFDNEFNKEITKVINKSYIDKTINEYVKIIVESIDLYKEKIYEDVINEVGVQKFTEFIEKKQVEEVEKRLRELITPNSILNDDLIEIPIGFRNILFGTCIHLANIISDDHSEYEKKSKIINLLSIKGIEFSTEQENFNDINKE